MAKILVVDDSMTARKVIVSLLSDRFEVIEASDGKEGLSKLQEVVGINFIFSDINMPWMSGLEMVAEIKQQENYNTIPICMLTTESSEQAVMEAKKLGVDAFLVKPVKSDQLQLVVDNYLKA